MTKNKKRLTRDIIIALALVLSGGIAVSMVGKHQAKKKIEKNVKTVLIPQTERKIDSLVTRRDSIVNFYEAEIDGLERTDDSLTAVIESQMQITDDQNGNKHIDLIGPMHDIEQLVKELHHQGVVAQTGDEMFDEDGSVYYVNEIYYRPDFEIKMPGKFYDYDPGFRDRRMMYFHENPMLSPEGDITDPWFVRKNFTVDDPVWFLYLMQEFCIPGMATDEEMHSVEGQVKFVGGTSIEYRIAVMETLQNFLKQLDNSQQIFNNATLEALSRAVQQELTLLYQQRAAQDRCDAAISEYKSVKGNLDKQINAQRQRLSELQSPNIVDVMYKNNKKDKSL